MLPRTSYTYKATWPAKQWKSWPSHCSVPFSSQNGLALTWEKVARRQVPARWGREGKDPGVVARRRTHGVRGTSVCTRVGPPHAPLHPKKARMGRFSNLPYSVVLPWRGEGHAPGPAGSLPPAVSTDVRGQEEQNPHLEEIYLCWPLRVTLPSPPYSAPAQRCLAQVTLWSRTRACSRWGLSLRTTWGMEDTEPQVWTWI